MAEVRHQKHNNDLSCVATIIAVNAVNTVYNKMTFVDDDDDDDYNQDKNNNKPISKSLIDYTNGNHSVESSYNAAVLRKMGEMVALVIGDAELTEDDIMTVAYNFSWFFLTDHLRALKTSRYQKIRENYDQYFLDHITTYFKMTASHAAIIQTMIDNNLKTIDEYIEFSKAHKNEQQDNNNIIDNNNKLPHTD